MKPYADFAKWRDEKIKEPDIIRKHDLWHTERALAILMDQFSEVFEEYFDEYDTVYEMHRAMRQTDFFESGYGYLDMVVWNLLHATRLIWEWEKETQEIP